VAAIGRCEAGVAPTLGASVTSRTRCQFAMPGSVESRRQASDFPIGILAVSGRHARILAAAPPIGRRSPDGGAGAASAGGADRLGVPIDGLGEARSRSRRGMPVPGCARFRPGAGCSRVPAVADARGSARGRRGQGRPDGRGGGSGG
jgi:hypothetical protein